MAGADLEAGGAGDSTEWAWPALRGACLVAPWVDSLPRAPTWASRAGVEGVQALEWCLEAGEGCPLPQEDVEVPLAGAA